MLKAAGIVLILTGAVGFGRYLSVSLGRYGSQLIECREIFVQMDAGREYLRLPYAQLLKRTAKGKEKLFAEILTEVADEMEKNKEADAGMLWEQAFCKRKREILLGKEEQEILLSLARSLLLETDHTQVAKIYFMQLEDTIKRAMEEKKEKQKLYGTVSILFGLFLVIMLL